MPGSVLGEYFDPENEVWKDIPAAVVETELLELRKRFIAHKNIPWGSSTLVFGISPSKQARFGKWLSSGCLRW